MGFGLLGAGAAVSGLMGGFQQGRKFAQDEERFDLEKRINKQRIRKGEVEMSAAELGLQEARSQASDRASSRKIDSENAALVEEFTKAFGSSAGSPVWESPFSSGQVQPATAAQPAAQPPGSGVTPPSAGISDSLWRAHADAQWKAMEAAGIALPPPGAAPGAAATPRGVTRLTSIHAPAQPVAQAAAPGAQAASPAPGQVTSQSSSVSPEPPRGANRFQALSDLHAKILNNEMRRPGADRGALIRQALEGAKQFRTAEVQETVDILNRFAAGAPQEAIFTELARRGKPVPAGSRISLINETTVAIGDTTVKIPAPDVIVALPDGRTVSRNNLLQQGMTAKELFDSNTDIGRTVGQMMHYANAQQAARDAAERDERRHRESMERYERDRENLNRQLSQGDRRLDLEERRRDEDRATSFFSSHYGRQDVSAADVARLSKLDDTNPVPDGQPSRLEQAESAASIARANTVTATITWNTNRDFGNLVSPAEVASALSTAATNPRSVKVDASTGADRAYVEIPGGKRVYIVLQPNQINALKQQSQSAVQSGSRDAAAAPDSSGAAPGAAAARGGQATGGLTSSITDVAIQNAFRKDGLVGYATTLLGRRPEVSAGRSATQAQRDAAKRWDEAKEELEKRLKEILRNTNQTDGPGQATATPVPEVPVRAPEPLPTAAAAPRQEPTPGDRPGVSPPPTAAGVQAPSPSRSQGIAPPSGAGARSDSGLQRQPASQEVIDSARASVASAEQSIVSLNGLMRDLRSKIDKASSEAERRRLDALLRDAQERARRSQEQRSSALRDLDRYGVQR